MNRIPSPNPHGAANVKDIEKFEEFIGEKLPNDIRKYFEKYNGGKWTKNIFLISSEDGKSSLHHVYGFFNSPDYKSMENRRGSSLTFDIFMASSVKLVLTRTSIFRGAISTTACTA